MTKRYRLAALAAVAGALAIAAPAAQAASPSPILTMPKTPMAAQPPWTAAFQEGAAAAAAGWQAGAAAGIAGWQAGATAGLAGMQAGAAALHGVFGPPCAAPAPR
jgi:hypothetical protein